MEERLRKFAHLVDVGSFTKAAAEMHISQPALSTAIAKLERELKARLLVRGVRPLTLTPAGKLAYRAAKDLSVQTDNLKLRLAELAHQPLNLRIGLIDSLASALFADGAALDLMETAKVSVVVNNSRYLADAVERGDLDIAFAAEQQGRLPSLLESNLVGTEPLAVVCHAQQRTSPGVVLGKTTAFGAEVLPNFIAYDQPSNTFRLVSEALKSCGVKPDISFYSTSPEVMLHLVLLNKGTAALPYLMVRQHLKAGRLKRLGNKRPWLIPRKIVAIKRCDRELPLTLKHLTNQVTMALNSLMTEAQPKS